MICLCVAFPEDERIYATGRPRQDLCLNAFLGLGGSSSLATFSLSDRGDIAKGSKFENKPLGRDRMHEVPKLTA